MTSSDHRARGVYTSPSPTIYGLPQDDLFLRRLWHAERMRSIGGGRLVIRSKPLSLTSDHVELGMCPAPGSYDCVSVTDTGEGTPDSIRDRIFEPILHHKESDSGEPALASRLCAGFSKPSAEEAPFAPRKDPGQRLASICHWRDHFHRGTGTTNAGPFLQGASFLRASPPCRDGRCT